MKITFENKKYLVPRVLPKNSVISDVDINEIKEKHNDLIDSFGWVEFRDTQHTEANRQTLTASSENTITINSGVTILSEKPKGGELLWNPTANKITPIKRGDSYDVRIDFKAAISQNLGYFEISINIGGNIGKTFGNVKVFRKGKDIVHDFSVAFPIYTLDTFVENGGLIFINPSNTMTIFDKRIIIFKIGQGK